MKKILLTAAAALAAFGVWAASAAFSDQGVLLDAEGAAMTGNKTIEFRLYAKASGGDVLWGRAYPVLLDSSGLFSVELSDASGSQISGTPGSSLAQVFADNAKNTLHLGMTVVGSSGEIAPRQKLLAVPYATFACDVSATSGDFAVAGRLTAASAEIAGSLKAGSIETAGSMNILFTDKTGTITSGRPECEKIVTVSGSCKGLAALKKMAFVFSLSSFAK